MMSVQGHCYFNAVFIFHVTSFDIQHDYHNNYNYKKPKQVLPDAILVENIM